MYEINHIFTHWRPMYAINEPSVFETRVFCLLFKIQFRQQFDNRFIHSTHTSTFSTTCFPKEQTFVEQVIVMFSLLSY